MRALLDLVFPRTCPSCAVPSRWLCEPCNEQVEWITTCCARCGYPTPRPQPTCARCRDLAFDVGRAAAVYDGPARDAMLAFKLGGERRAARDLAAAMARVVPAADVVTAVPSTRRAKAARGFNPAEELARHVAMTMNRPYGRLLAKIRETADQAGLGRTDRRANLAGAFKARPVEGDVLVVDDILTTGATADACARALREAGAAKIGILTFATAR